MAWFLLLSTVTDSPAGTGMSNAFLLFFVLFLNETIVQYGLPVEEVRPDAERDDSGRENCQQREQHVARLPVAVRRLAQPVFPVVAEGIVAGAALSVVVCHIYGLNIVFFVHETAFPPFGRDDRCHDPRFSVPADLRTGVFKKRHPHLTAEMARYKCDFKRIPQQRNLFIKRIGFRQTACLPTGVQSVVSSLYKI